MVSAAGRGTGTRPETMETDDMMTFGDLFPGVFAERVERGDVISFDRRKRVEYVGPYFRHEHAITFEGRIPGKRETLTCRVDARTKVEVTKAER